MATHKETKLKTLFKLLQSNNVITTALLDSKGVSRNLRKYYLESGWLEAFGRGAYKKPDDLIEWEDAVSAIQKQTETNVHVGGLSALSLGGYGHYFRLSKETLYLFSPRKNRLPKWFTDYNWGLELFHIPTALFSNEIGLSEISVKQISVRVSSPERAIMECLHLAPKKMDLVECYQVFEGLVNLKPKLISELLTNCNSVKVKRLFLYMAEKANHGWYNFLKTESINLGSGDRMITKKGVYNSKYLISIPTELEEL